jgi:hypothetical protein
MRHAFLRVPLFSPINIIPEMLLTLLHPHVALVSRTTGEDREPSNRAVIFPKSGSIE